MNIKQKLENWIKETLGIEGNIVLVHPANLENGDFTYITNSENPDEVLSKLNENKISEIKKIEIANNRFINIFLSKEFFAKEISSIDKDYGKTEILKDKKIFIEHTQPNPFKEFHIGHLMNNAIGESVSRFLKSNGAEVKTASYHGDVGLHVAKTIWAKKKDSKLSLGEAYTEGSIKFEENKEEIIEINKKVYDRSDEEINRIYDDGRKESLDSFEKIYQKLDSHFDFHFFESQSGEVGKKIVKENVGKTFEESEGAVIFRGENFEPKTHTRVFLSKEGLPTYEAKEVGLAKIKRDTWPDYDKSITVTANEQDSFFKVVEVAIGEVFPELKGKLVHLSHGMLKLPTGKMSSRTGDIITAEHLIQEVKDKILEKIKERDFNDEEKQNIAEMVAVGAIKYTILRQAVGGDIIFDFDRSISFEGDSGPYLQYTAVRANSVLEKAGSVSNKNKISQNWETTELEKILYRFPEIVSRAGSEYSPHHLVTYLTELASAFNNFYAHNKIVDENDEASPYKLAITKAVSTVLTNGLHLLGIKVPERM